MPEGVRTAAIPVFDNDTFRRTIEVELTQAQFDELLEVFPEGVCNWDAAGVGQTTPSMSDRTYEDAETPAGLA